jgi:beta-lactamase class A
MRITLIGLLVAVLVGAVHGVGVSGERAYPRLRDSFDPVLQKGLERSIRKLKLTNAVKRQQLGVSLVDVTDPRRPRVAAVNGDEMIYAASLPKIAILLGAFVLIEKGEIKFDKVTQQDLTAMIRVSSNHAATKMLHRVGKPRLAQILESKRYRFYDPEVNGGLWVGKDYAKNAVWKRDPLHNLSHGATALQTARFYYYLDTNRLVSPELSRKMKKILSHPGIHHKFVKGLESRPGVRMYRKSGSWKRWHADSALVEHNGHKYIAVALAENPAGGRWMERLILELDDLILASGAPAASSGESASRVSDDLPQSSS